MRTSRLLLAASLLTLTALAACSHPIAPTPGAWQRTDLWLENAQIELSLHGKAVRPVAKKISFLGAAEVRDMSKVPPAQLAAFPRRTAGQVRALDQQIGSRLKWHLRLPPTDPYFSFVPLGSEAACACRYRMGVRADGKITELYTVAVEPVGPIAKATVEVDLTPWANQEIDLLLQIDEVAPTVPGAPPLPPGAPAPPPGPTPSALWGSPAIYGRSAAVPRQKLGDPKKPNVLFIGIDTLRADAVGVYRPNPRTTSLTPSLDQLAAESDVYLNAYSAFNVTNPSFISMMTGLYGKRHGVYDLKTPLPPGHTTMADVFSKAGYDTMAIISARHLGNHNSGLGQGFKDVTEPDEHFAAELATDMSIDWFATHLADPARRDHPFFAWIHLFDPHTPHTPPDPYALGLRPAAPAGLGMVESWVVFRPPGPRPFTEAVLGGNLDLYYGEVAYVDRQVGRLLDFLDSHGLRDDTLVVVVADHGENLGEHGINFRHVGLFETTTHVPMMIRWPQGTEPARPPQRIAGLVQSIDLFPTVLNGAGLVAPPSDGIDLRKMPTGGRRAVFSEHAEKLGVSVRTRTHRYLISQGNLRFLPDGPSLYDEQADPGEVHSLAGTGLAVEKELDGLLARWLADRSTAPAPRPQDISDEDAQRLKALGYN